MIILLITTLLLFAFLYSFWKYKTKINKLSLKFGECSSHFFMIPRLYDLFELIYDDSPKLIMQNSLEMANNFCKILVVLRQVEERYTRESLEFLDHYRLECINELHTLEFNKTTLDKTTQIRIQSTISLINKELVKETAHMYSLLGLDYLEKPKVKPLENSTQIN